MYKGCTQISVAMTIIFSSHSFKSQETSSLNESNSKRRKCSGRPTGVSSSGSSASANTTLVPPPLSNFNQSRRSLVSLRTICIISVVVVTTFLAHMQLQLEYFARCKSNVFKVVMFKQSYMCTHMASVLSFIENTYLFGLKRIVETFVFPLYQATLTVLGIAAASGNT